MKEFLKRKIRPLIPISYPLAYGISTFLPFVPPNLLWNKTGGTDSARYCYSVWMRHLLKAASHGLKIPPITVAELGPGDSVGIGLAALLTGSSKYFALDVVKHADLRGSISILEELVELITERAPIPDQNEFPEVKPPLENYSFPRKILGDELLETALNPKRIRAIRECLSGETNADSMLQYLAPWTSKDVVKPETVDFLFSQAVMEHVDDLSGAYRAVYSWLKPGGICQHQVDFKSHGLFPSWDGHRAKSELYWKLYRGKRPYLINREPCSTHLNLIRSVGLELVEEKRFEKAPEISRAKLAARFKNLTEADRETSGVFIVARKNDIFNNTGADVRWHKLP